MTFLSCMWHVHKWEAAFSHCSFTFEMFMVSLILMCSTNKLALLKQLPVVKKLEPDKHELESLYGV